MAIKRISAQLIDFILYPFVSSFLFLLAINLLATARVDQSTENLLKILVIVIAGSISIYIYYFVQYKHILKGQTWGYKLMGIKLIYPEGGNKKRLAIYRTIFRPFLGMLSFTMLFGVLHIFLLVNSKGEEGIMDALLKTKAIGI